jgi:hypothetical protein
VVKIQFYAFQSNQFGILESQARRSKIRFAAGLFIFGSLRLCRVFGTHKHQQSLAIHPRPLADFIQGFMKVLTENEQRKVIRTATELPICDLK